MIVANDEVDAAVFSDDSDHQEFVVPNLEAEDERKFAEEGPVGLRCGFNEQRDDDDEESTKKEGEKDKELITDTSDDSEEDSSLSDLLDNSDSEEENQSADSDIEAAQMKQLVGKEGDCDCS